MNRLVIAFAMLPILLGCSGEPTYKVLYRIESPDKMHVAVLEYVEEGTLGSTRYRMIISNLDGSESIEAFRGTNAWTASPVWLNSSAVVLPFCFGSIRFIESVRTLLDFSKLDASALLHRHPPLYFPPGFTHFEPT